MAITLEKEFQYYIENQGQLVDKYNGKYLVIKNHDILGAFDSQIEAIQITQKQHELGSFMVHKVGPGKENYTQTFHSRVRFA